jgi:2-phospho-L-lactate guanylyltransferase
VAHSRPPVGGLQRGWTVVLPLKGGPGAKSRLGGGPDLARAIAGDCLDAVLACPAVRRTLVVTADLDMAAQARTAGAEPVAERIPGAGLTAAVLDGVAAAGRGGPVAVLLGDLPALRPGDLAAGLAAVQATLEACPGAPMAALPDAEGSGTVLLGARRAADLDPAFGPGSMALHLVRGAVAVHLDSARLRRDVDTPDDLSAALALGVGPRTAALAAIVPSGC